MRRHTYATPRARKVDQIWGSVTAVLLNTVLSAALSIGGASLTRVLSGLAGAATAQIIGALIPWVVNGLLVALLFLLRPAMGVGYIMAFALVIMAVLALGGLFFASCLIGLAVALLFSALSSQLGAGILLVVWIGGLFWGFFLLVRMAYLSFSGWWDEED